MRGPVPVISIRIDSDATKGRAMGPHRIRFTIRDLMIAVLVAAILLSLPIAGLVVLASLTTILAIMIFAPAGVAPPGRRVETAYWAMALHPLALLAWLSALRIPGHCPILYDQDKGLLFGQFLEVPYILAYLSLYYLPILGIVGGAVAVYCFPRPTLVKPLLPVPITWMTTWVVLMWDPFELQSWVWD
jgi:hypothetical protein